jgi:hypothetical protein
MKTIVSYGGGTNSTALLIGLMERGEQPDAITFADTGGEKPHTYDYIEIMNSWCKKVGFPVIEILKGDTPQQIIDGSLEQECLRLGNLPAKAYGFSTCSVKWKIEPQRRYDKRFAEKHGIELCEITRLVGFDADEHNRVARALANSHKSPVKMRYPLYEWNWGREECINAIKRAGLPQPGKSACFFCPSTKKSEILELREKYPDLLERALKMERIALAGEGRAPATRCKGLGRSFNWAEFLSQVDASLNKETCSINLKENLLSNAGIPEMDCGCYDG